MLQPYEEENTEDMKNKILARIEELKQEMANIREGEEIINVDVNTQSLGNIWDLSAKCDDDLHANSSNNCESDSFETHDVNPSNSCENVSCGIHDNAFENGSCDVNDVNSFNSNDNDGLELFTFDDNSLLNEHDGELHYMLCDDDDELNVNACLLDLNDIEFNVLFEEVNGKIIEEEKEKTRDESVREEVEDKDSKKEGYIVKQLKTYKVL
nr:hypothetical protein Iba_chr10dCG13260 [Ipomoea batatas]